MQKGEYKTYKTCQKCDKEKPLTREFFKRINSSGGFHDTCKDCDIVELINKHWKDDLLICNVCNKFLPEDSFPVRRECLHRKNRDIRCKKCKSQQSSNSRLNKNNEKQIDRIFIERWQGLRDRSKEKNWEIYYDVDYLKELFEKQNHKCAISGIEMTTILGKGRIPTNISVDRIDTNLPYTKENTQLVCMAVNQMKSDLTTENLLHFCKQIIKTHEGNNSK